MYCQSCGTEIQPGLTYCNRCGAQVASLAPAQGERVAFAPTDVSGPAYSVTDHTTHALAQAHRGPRA